MDGQSVGVETALQVLEQLKLEPEAAMLTDRLIEQAGAVHTIVPAGHRMGTPQVRRPHYGHSLHISPTPKLQDCQASRLTETSLLHVEQIAAAGYSFASYEAPYCIASPGQT